MLLKTKMETNKPNTIMINKEVPYFSDYKMHFSSPIWEEMGVSYSLKNTVLLFGTCFFLFLLKQITIVSGVLP